MSTAAKSLLEVETRGRKIRSQARKIWIDETPEERVRQEYLCVLVNEYGYALDQIAEEEAVPLSRGSAQARADFTIWRSIQDKIDDKPPFIVVECKADNVTIDQRTYQQGANYAQYQRAPFFVTHNNRETKYWKVDLERRAPNFYEISNIPHAGDTDRQIKELLSKLKVFKENEFADLLHKCHSVIRNREHLDPAAAFDEIAKILFLKVNNERRLRKGRARKNLFTAEFLDEQKDIHRDPVNVLFNQTKEDYESDRIFGKEEKINLGFDTAREIVRLLESYDLSDTSEDIKGIAFERFLGRTFRGEIGQFFTPRSIVEFMIRFVEPHESDIICDPASGSGGFLIRFFEIVREQILADVDREYQAFSAKLKKQKMSDAERAERLNKKYVELQATIDPAREGSRLWQLANRCIYGTDANERMARTSKMNMIMHGDGHGGVHHHNGFLNVNGIFDGRFDLVLTNPPFGASVEASDRVQESDVNIPRGTSARYEAEYGELYREAQAEVRAAVGKPLASLFKLPKAGGNKTKTEILFIERCLALLKPGGRLGIVLPEGIFNNPSLQYVREFCEDRAFIRAVVSLPQETFYSSGASVKASLLFMQKFTEAEQTEFERILEEATAETEARHREELDRLDAVIAQLNASAKDFLAGKKKPSADERREAARRAKEANAELRAHKAEAQRELKRLREQIRREARGLLKERFAYPVFLYEADKVGITATGEPDQNELYPNESVPPGVEQTCLELHREFAHQPTQFNSNAKTKSVQFEHLRLWSVKGFIERSWNWPTEYIRPLSVALLRKQIEAGKDARESGILHLVTIHFDGSMKPRATQDVKNFKGKLYLASEGDVIYSKIDVRNGAIGIVPEGMAHVAVSSEFPVYEVMSDVANPLYIKLLFRTSQFKQIVNGMVSGTSGRKRVQPEQLERVEVPLPPLDIQQSLLADWRVAQEELAAATRKAREAEAELEALILGTKQI